MSELDEQIRDITTRMFAYGIDWTEFKDKSEKDHTVSTYAGKIKQSMADEVRKDITKLIANQVREARIDELNRISADPGEVIPYKHDSFAMGMNFYQSRIADRLAELQSTQPSNKSKE